MMSSVRERTSAIGRGPVGPVLGVADVDQLLLGQLVEDGAGDGEATHSGVEDPDRRVVHPCKANLDSRPGQWMRTLTACRFTVRTQSVQRSQQTLLQPREQFVDGDDDVGADMLVSRTLDLLDPLTDLLEHPHGVEVAVALEIQTVGEHDPHVVEGAEHRHRTVLVEHDLAVSSAGAIQDRASRAGDRRACRRRDPAGPAAGTPSRAPGPPTLRGRAACTAESAGSRGIAPGELGLEAAQRILALRSAVAGRPRLGVDPEISADQIRASPGRPAR